jgi:hypothetical protein
VTEPFLSGSLEELMVRRSGWMFLGASAFTGVLLVWSSLAGCQPDGYSTTYPSTQSGNGGGNSSGTSNATGAGGNTATTASANGSGTSTSASSGAGGGGSSGPMAVTIKDVTTGVVGPGVIVKVPGIVAMSQKFLVSKGSTSGSCLWGIFASDPNLTETAPNTGILVLAYGLDATVPDGGTTAFCPRLGFDTTGDSIPDDTKPGDVIDVIGKTSYFRLPNCDDKVKNPGASDVAEYQIAEVSSVKKTGTATPPAPHAMTEAELVQLASPTDKDFHNQWGGVKVRIENVTSVPQDPGTGPSITDKFGHIVVMGSNLQVGDKLYYRGYNKTDFCFAAPVYPSPTTTFTAIDGFSYMDFCTWGLVPNDKCADLAPPSPVTTDCNGSATACTK